MSNVETSFPYRCPLCDFDLHVRCARLLQVMVHMSHPLHSLLLVYNSATPPMFGVSVMCNVAMDGRFGSYNCYALCDYHIHASCDVNKPSLSQWLLLLLTSVGGGGGNSKR